MSQYFFAWSLSSAQRAGIVRYRQDLQAFTDDADQTDGLSWVSPVSYHLTLCFLGRQQLDVGLLHSLSEQALMDCRPISIRCSELVELDISNGLRVYGLRTLPRAALLSLHDRLCSVALAAGLTLTDNGAEPSGNVYSPHITLARVSERVPPLAARPGPEGDLLLDKIGLFKSPARRGDAYIALFEIPLRTAGRNTINP